MKASYDQDACRLHLRFDSDEEAAAFAAAVERESGFLVRLTTRLKLHDPVTVTATSASTANDVAGGEDKGAEIPARVAQVFDQGAGEYGTALLLDDPAAARRLLGGSAASETATRPNDPPEPPPDAPLPDAPQAADSATSGEMLGTSPMHRIKQMNPRQRALLAMKAGRTERQILLRDNSPQVLQNLLNNPHIDAEEVLQIARSSHTVAPILQRIASDSRWNGNQEILALVARHPKTPSLFASRLLPSLRTSDLRMMAKMSSGLKEAVRKAALREYMRRTGQQI